MAKRFVLLHVNPKLEDSLSPPPAPSSLSLSAPQKQPSLNTDESLIHQKPSSSSSIRLMKPSPASSSSPSPSPSRRVSLPAVGLDQKAQTEAVLRSPEAPSTSLYKEEKEENHSVVVELGPLEGKNSNITVDSKLRAEEREWNAAAVQEQRKFNLDEEEKEMVDRKRESIITHIANMQKVGDDNRTNDQIRRHSFHGLNNNSGGGGGGGGAIKEFSRRRSLDIKRVEKRRIYVRPELTYQFVEVIRPERSMKAPKLGSAQAEMEENMTEVPKFSKKLLENKAQAPGIPQKLVEIEVKAPESPQKVQESTIEVPKRPKNAVTLSLSPTRVIPGRRRSSRESLSSKRESIHSENQPDFPSNIASDVHNRKLVEGGDGNRKESMLNPENQSRGSGDDWDSRQSIRNLMRRRSSSRRSPSRRSKSPSIVSSMLQRHSYRESMYTNRHTQSIHGIVRPVREEGRSEISDDSSIEDGSSMDLFMGLKMKQEFLALQQNLEEEQKLKREEENQKMSRRSVVFITSTSINSRAGSMNLGLTSQSQAPTVEEASRRLSGSIISDNNTSTVESNLVPLVYPDHCCRHKRRYPYGIKVESSKDIITTVESDFIPEDRLHITESLEEGLGTIQRYWENQQTRPKSAFHVFKPIENSTTTQRYSKTGAATEDSIEQVYQASETLMNPPEVQDTLVKESQPSPKKSSISSENPVSVPQRSNYKEETQVGDPIHQHDDGQKPSAKSLMSDQNCQRAENQQQSNELDQSPSAKRLPSKNWQRVENHHQSNENETPSVKRVDNHKSNESTKSPTAKSSSSTKAPNDLFDKQFTATRKLEKIVQFEKASAVQEFYKTQSIKSINRTKQGSDEDIKEKNLSEKGMAAMEIKHVNAQSIEESDLSKYPSVHSLLLIDSPRVKQIKSEQGYDQEFSEGGVTDQNPDSSSLFSKPSDYIENQQKLGIVECTQDLEPQESDNQTEVYMINSEDNLVNDSSDVNEQNCTIRYNIDMNDSRDIPINLQASIDPDPKASLPRLMHSHTFSASANTQEKVAWHMMEERRRHTAPPESWISENEGGNDEALMRGEYSNTFLTLNTEDNNVDSSDNLWDGEGITNSRMDDAKESHNSNFLLPGAQIEYSDGAPNINSEAGSQPHANHTVDRGSFSLPSSSSGNNVLHSQTGGRMEEECSEDSALNEEVLFLPSADLQQEEGKNGILISSSTLTSTSVVEEFQKPDSTAVLIPQYQRSSLLSSSLNARDDSSETKDLPLRKSTAEYRSMDLTEKGINQSYDGFESNKLEVITHILVEEEGDDLDAVQEASSSYMRQNYCQDAVMGFQTEDLGLMIEQEEEEEETHPIMSLQQPRLSLMSTTIDNSYGFLSSPKASLPLLQRESQFAILPISKGVEKEDERRRKSVIIEALQLASPLKNELSDNRTRRKSSLQNLGSELPIPGKRSSLQDLEQESEEDKRIESRSSFLQNGRGEEVGYDLAEMMQMLGKRSSSKSLLQAGMENDEKRIRRSSHSRKNSEQRINRIKNIATKSKDRLLSEYIKRKKKSSILASSPVEEKERKMQDITNSNHNTDSSLLTEIHSPYAFLLLLLLLLLLMLAVVPAIRFICQAGSFATHIQNYGQPPT